MSSLKSLSSDPSTSAHPLALTQHAPSNTNDDGGLYTLDYAFIGDLVKIFKSQIGAVRQDLMKGGYSGLLLNSLFSEETHVEIVILTVCARMEFLLSILERDTIQSLYNSGVSRADKRQNEQKIPKIRKEVNDARKYIHESGQMK